MTTGPFLWGPIVGGEGVRTEISALIVLEKDDASSAKLMAEVGAIEVLLEILRSHQCEEAIA